MSLRELRLYRVALPARHQYTMSNSAVSTPFSTVVELIDSDGLRGYGEVCLASPQYQSAHSAGVVASFELLAPAVLGLDPLQHSVVGISDADTAAAEAVRLQDTGITRIQLKAGGRPIDQDIDAIRAVAGVMRPSTDLAVDTNRGWTSGEAIRVSNACAGLTLSLEQPCATEAELAAIKPHLRHPLIVDENATDLRSIARQISQGTADGFGLKLSRLGGLSTMQAVRNLCHSARVPMSSDDAWGGDIIAAAGVAFGATLDPALSRGAWIAHPYHQTHYDDTHGPRLENGYVTLPRGGHGLGLLKLDSIQADSQ